jgi:hypothetical protein
MSFFCFLWVPLFYLLRRSIIGGGGSSGGVWALLFGSIMAVTSFFLGYLVRPGGFGMSRMLFGFIDIVSLPVIIPLVLYALLYFVRGISGEIDFTNFTLLWLFPVAGLRAIGWSPTNDPVLLVWVPILWTALAVGIPYLINVLVNSSNPLITIAMILCMLILPVLAAGVYWAFFSQNTALAFLLLAATHIPLAFSFVFDVMR